MIVAGLALTVAAAGFALWVGLGKPGLTKTKPPPVVTVLSAPARVLSGILAPDALLFEPGPRDGGSDPIEEAVALTEIQCDSTRKAAGCRAGLASTLIPGGQVHAVDGLVRVARARCRRELRRLAVVVRAAEAADRAFGADGPIPAVQASWAASRLRYLTTCASTRRALRSSSAASSPARRAEGRAQPPSVARARATSIAASAFRTTSRARRPSTAARS